MTEWVQLGEIITQAPLIRCDDGKYPVLSMTMHDGIVLQADRFKKNLASSDTSSYKVVRRNQLVEGFPIDEGVIYVQKVVDEGIMSPAYRVWDIDMNKIEPDYLDLTLHSERAIQYYKSKLRGTTARRRSLPTATLLAMKINMPSKAEQKLFVTKLKDVQSVVNTSKCLLEKLDTFVKSRFIEMFGDPVTNPMGWEVKKLKDISRKISDGVHAKPEYTGEGKPFLSVVNINKGKVDFSNCKFVSQSDYEKMIKSTNPEKGDVLYTKVGATYGIPAYVDTDEKFCLYVSVCLIKPRHELVNARFLTESMRLPYIKHQADRRIRGIGVPDLHLNQISEFDVLCPPMELQERYIDFVTQVDKSKSVLQKLLEKQELLQAALMQEYFG